MVVVALLLFLAATVVSGLVLYGEENHAGPLAPLFTADHPAGFAVSPAAADEKERPRAGPARQTEDK